MIVTEEELEVFSFEAGAYRCRRFWISGLLLGLSKATLEAVLSELSDLLIESQ